MQRRFENPRPMLHRAALRIRRSIIHPRNPRMHHRPRTHRTRLQRNPQITPIQPVLPQRLSSRANRQNLGMRRRVMTIPRPIMRRRNHHPIPDHHRPDRHGPHSHTRLRQRAAHRFGQGPASIGHPPPLARTSSACESLTSPSNWIRARFRNCFIRTQASFKPCRASAN